MVLLFIMVLIFKQISELDTACSGTLPLSAGTWKTSSRGIWTVDDTRSNISNFELTISSADGAFNVIMNCEDDTTDNDGYILLKTASPYLIDGISKYIYTCIFFAKQTTATNNAYYFYLGVEQTTISAGVYEQIVLLPTSISFPFSTICSSKSRSPDRTHVTIKAGTEDTAAITCPSSIQGTFSYSDTTCSNTFLDVCSTTTHFNFNYSICAETQLFSAGGDLQCVYSGSSGSYNYIILYNNDNSPDGSTHYQFVCLVYSTGDVIKASINPEECFDSSLQSPTSTTHPRGIVRSFTKYNDSACYTSLATAGKSDSMIGVIVGVTVSMVTVVIIVIVMVFYCKRGKNRTKVISTERPRQKTITPPLGKPKEHPSAKLTENKSTINQKEEPASIERTQINRLSHDSGIIEDILSDHFTDNQMPPYSTACQ